MRPGQLSIIWLLAGLLAACSSTAQPATPTAVQPAESLITPAATVVAILAWALDGETVRSPGSGSLLVFAGIGAWALAVAVGLRQRRASE